MVSDENMQVGLKDTDKDKKEKQVLDENERSDAESKNSVDTANEAAEEKEPVEMVEIPKTRFEELENAESLALEEIKRERASVINYRKRLEKQRDEFAEISSVRVLSKLLDVKDDVNRILENGKESIPSNHLEGIKLMAQRIKTIFDQEGVTLLEIKEGKSRFDPRYHEPILVQPNPDLPDKTIITVVNVGFVKGERVLRPAKVIITQKPSEPKEEKEESSVSDENKASLDSKDSETNSKKTKNPETSSEGNEVQNER
ncbi:MAG: nucleotide exchange factor GrpE [Candidatus Kariarchaeaceae archaeon]|jgi:molecular chaperone GrpE